MWLFSSCFTVKSQHHRSVSEGFTVCTTYHIILDLWFSLMFERVHYFTEDGYLHHILTECVPTIYGGGYMCIYVTMWFRGVGFMEQCLKLDSEAGEGWWGWGRPSIYTESHCEEEPYPWQICVDGLKKENICKRVVGVSCITCSKHQNRIYILILLLLPPHDQLWEPLFIKNSIYGRRTSSTAVQINFQWAVSPEGVLLSHRINSIKRQK